MLTFTIFLSMFVSCLFLTITLFLSQKSFYSNNKFSPFECGFNPINSTRVSFSIQFFFIAILFLIFDIEIILIFPISISLIKNTQFLISSLIMLLILILGLFFEWKTGSLNWK